MIAYSRRIWHLKILLKWFQYFIRPRPTDVNTFHVFIAKLIATPHYTNDITFLGYDPASNYKPWAHFNSLSLFWFRVGRRNYKQSPNDHFGLACSCGPSGVNVFVNMSPSLKKGIFGCYFYYSSNSQLPRWHCTISTDITGKRREFLFFPYFGNQF